MLPETYTISLNSENDYRSLAGSRRGERCGFMPSVLCELRQKHAMDPKTAVFVMDVVGIRIPLSL